MIKRLPRPLLIGFFLGISFLAAFNEAILFASDKWDSHRHIWDYVEDLSYDEHKEPKWETSLAFFSVRYFESFEDLQVYVRDKTVLGQSTCRVFKQEFLTHCELWIIKPRYDDEGEWLFDEARLEIMHGIYGEDK